MRKILNLYNKLKYFFAKGYWISLSSKFSIDTVLEGNNRIFPGANISGSKIGLGTYVGEQSFLPRTKILRFSTIGPNVNLVRGSHPAHDFISIHPAFYSIRKQAGFTFVDSNKFSEFSKNEFSIEIGHDVWIGSNVLILDGKKIGDGAIIGSGSIVSKDISPYTINVGNPIKEIGKRFTDEEIKFLLKVKWWNKDFKWIKENAESFDSIDNFRKLFK